MVVEEAVEGEKGRLEETEEGTSLLEVEGPTLETVSGVGECQEDWFHLWVILFKTLLTGHHRRAPWSPWWVEIRGWWSVRSSTWKRAIHGTHSRTRRG